MEPLRLSSSLADDSERRPEERHLDYLRAVYWTVVGSSSGPMAALILGAALAFEQPAWALALQILGWLIITTALIWWARVWPALEHQHTSYRVSSERIEIRHGVFWRSATSVPLSRVQHTDVTQGPIERRLDLATLVVHTAGTESATVNLPGLSPATASALRNFLVRGGGDDAV